VLEQGCLLPYEGEGPFFACSLAEPVGCIVSAFRTSYHNDFNSHVLQTGLLPGGTMLLMAGCGAMGLAAIDIACHNPESRPRRLVVTDVDEARLARAAEVFGLAWTPGGKTASGRVAETELHFVNTSGMSDPVTELKAFNLADDAREGVMQCVGGYDDVFLFAAVPALVPQASELLGFGGCLNFFAGPMDQDFFAPINFYGIHYYGHRCVGSSGGDVADMVDSLDWIARGLIHPEVMVTHVGGLDSAAEATLSLPAVPGGKRLVYTQRSLPMTPIEDFERLGETDPLFAELARITAANRGLWCQEAEACLLARAPRLAPPV
jgi:threonine dehydrogenase-like Zn-dependent dehydrogenase